MNDFWTNLFRYPRFLISSVAGLIFILLTPLRTLWRRKPFRLLVGICIVVILGLLALILNQMLGF